MKDTNLNYLPLIANIRIVGRPSLPAGNYFRLCRLVFSFPSVVYSSYSWFGLGFRPQTALGISPRPWSLLFFI